MSDTKEAKLKVEEEAADERLKTETARLKAKVKPKEKIPTELYLILTSGESIYHGGRSAYASKHQGFRFDQGNVIRINHPTDVLYFLQKKMQRIEVYEELPTKYGHRHLIDRSVPEKLRIDKKGNVAKFWKDALRDVEKALNRSEPTGPIKMAMVKVQ